MGSGGFFPEQDFEGAELQDIGDLSKTPDLLNFASYYGGRCGVVAFVWLPESDEACGRFVESLDQIPDERLTAALLRLFFEHCENVHMSPDWWDGLPKLTRTAIVERMTASTDPEKARPKAILANDGLHFSPWTVVRRYRLP
jgi:hypothetical protein